MTAVTKLTPKKLKTFCDTLARTGNVTASAEAADMSRQIAYKLKGQNKEFAKAWDDALEQCLDRIEQSLIGRATEGWDEPVFHQGVRVGAKRKFSDMAGMFMLNGRRSQIFKNPSAPPSPPPQHVTVSFGNAPQEEPPEGD